MVQVETSQLTSECKTWREALRDQRLAFTRNKEKLQHVASGALSKDQLQDVEHLQNQFHIQLINIHDLRHAIKAHSRIIEHEVSINNGHINEDRVAMHEYLYNEYQRQDAVLQELREEFGNFLGRVS